MERGSSSAQKETDTNDGDCTVHCPKVPVLETSGTRIVFFDFETNGMKDCAVLSASAMTVYFLNGAFILCRRFNRFYTVGVDEEYNQKAIEVNGLTLERVKELRGDCHYSERFLEDDDWLELCRWGDLFVAHNAKFDRSFMRFDPPEIFCTMEVNAPIVRAGWNRRYQNWRWPKLHKTAEFYGITVDQERLHEGFYDVELCFQIFRQMYIQRNPNVCAVLEKE